MPAIWVMLLYVTENFHSIVGSKMLYVSMQEIVLVPQLMVGKWLHIRVKLLCFKNHCNTDAFVNLGLQLFNTSVHRSFYERLANLNAFTKDPFLGF